MSANTFYGSKVRSYRAVTLQDALAFADICNSAANVSILPPDCGNQNISSDEEDFDDHQLNQDQIFESSGELEVRAASDDFDDDSDDDQERAAPETKRSASKWKKTCSLATIITKDLRESVDEQYPELLRKIML